MTKHQGKIVEYIIRRKGYNISQLAIELHIDRRTLYNLFQSQNLKTNFVQKLGKLIGHDFSIELPELFISGELKEETINTDTSNLYQKKYIDLLGNYNVMINKLEQCRKQYPGCC